MGRAGSWFAIWYWVITSRRLPLALAAQLIIAETVFDLAYGVSFDGCLPTPAEAIGAAMQIAGVCSAIAVFNRPRPLDAPISRFAALLSLADFTAVEVDRSSPQPRASVS